MLQSYYPVFEQKSFSTIIQTHNKVSCSYQLRTTNYLFSWTPVKFLRFLEYVLIIWGMVRWIPAHTHLWFCDKTNNKKQIENPPTQFSFKSLTLLFAVHVGGQEWRLSVQFNELWLDEASQTESVQTGVSLKYTMLFILIYNILCGREYRGLGSQ